MRKMTPLILLFIVAGITFTMNAVAGSAEWKTDWATPKVFIENKGQFDIPGKGSLKSEVLYAFDDGGTRIFFTKNGVAYSFISKSKRSKKPGEGRYDENGNKINRVTVKKDLVEMLWVNSNPHVIVTAENKVPDYYSYGIKMNGEEKNLNYIRAFKSIYYKELYPLIDVRYDFHQQEGLKYTLILHPGADISKVQMKYSDNSVILLQGNGDLHITTLFGDIIDHAPITFYESDKAPVTSEFTLKDHTVSFALGNYDKTRALVIDPWTVTPSFSNCNKIWECERDAAGNAYLYGGDTPMRLRKYSSGGILQWTYNSPWDTAGYWVGSLLTDLAGNSYITSGSNGEIRKISTAGAQVWFNNPNGFLGPIFEYWHLTFNCDQTQLVIGGMRAQSPLSTSSYRGAVMNINLTNGAVLSYTVVGWMQGFNIKEARTICSSPNGNFYFLTLDSVGCLNNTLSLVYKTPTGYNFSYGIPNYGVTNQGISAIRANGNFLYTQNGNTLQKRNLANGAVITSVNIPGGVSVGGFGGNAPGNSGLDLDSCGNVYVGSVGQVHKYDANLNLISSVNTTSAVYDVAVTGSGEVLICGNGFASSLNMGACRPMQVICGGTPLSVLTTPANILCNGQCTGSAVSNPSGGTSPYTYLWSNGQTTQTATGLCAGTYTVTVTDAALSTMTSTVTITAPSAITSGANGTSTTCGNNNGTATVTASGGTGPLSYVWSPSGQTTTTATGLASGTYTVTITDANGCSQTATATVNPSGVPGITLQSQQNILCNGGVTGSATINVTGGNGPYSYNWTPGGGTNSTATGLSAQTYTVLVTDQSGCTATQTITLSEPPAITSTTGSTPAACSLANGTATVIPGGGTPGYTYLWNNGQTTSTATALATGSYTVTVTDANGCTYSTSVTVTSANGPAITVQSQTNVLCNGGNNGSAAITVTGGTSPYSYSWSPAGGTNATATGLSGGTYTVTVTDANGCSQVQTVTITEPAVLSSSTTSSPSACGSSTGMATTSPSGGTPGYTYVWSNGQTSATATGLAAGIYTVTITDANGCTLSSTASVVNSNGPTATATTTNVNCNGGTNGSSSVSATGGTAPYTYLWSNGQTTATATGLSAGTYTVTVTDAGGCTSTQVITIIQPPALLAATSPVDASCGFPNGSATTNVSGGTAPYTYAWTPTGGTANTATGLAAGTYTVIITDVNGCTATSSVTVANTPGANIIASGDTTIAIGGSATLMAGGGITYAWSPSTGLSCSTCPDPVASPTATTTYTVIVTDANGCTGTATVTVSVVTKCGDNGELFVPDAFSPNGDHTNDVLYVRGGGISEFYFAVYDRWGEKVFESTDVSQGWDGQYRGKSLDAAVFIYYLTAKCFSGEEIKQKGNVTLFR